MGGSERGCWFFCVASPLGATVLVISYRLELWLIVLGLVAFAAVLLRRHLEDRLIWLPALVAVRALGSMPHRPAGCGVEVETSSAELAILARGQLLVLDRAAELDHRDVEPDRWATSIGRLTVAHELLDQGRVPGVVRRSGTSGRQMGAWSAATTAAVVGSILTSSRWWLVPLAVGYTGAVTTWTSWRDERQWRPKLVAAASRSGGTAPHRDPAGGSAAELARLGRGRLGSIRRGMRAVEQWDGPERDKARAAQSLAMTAVLLKEGLLVRATSARVVVMWTLTLTAALATWLVTA